MKKLLFLVSAVLVFIGCQSNETNQEEMSQSSVCPFHSGETKKQTTNRDWWPNQLDLSVLSDAHIG